MGWKIPGFTGSFTGNVTITGNLTVTGSTGSNSFLGNSMVLTGTLTCANVLASGQLSAYNYITAGDNPVGTTMADAGAIRLIKNVGIYAKDNTTTANQNIRIAGTDTNNNVLVGDVTLCARTKVAGNVAVQIAMTSPVFEVGTALLSTIGDVRFASVNGSNRTIISTRNNANSADVSILSVDTSDTLYIGQATNGGTQAASTTVCGSSTVQIRASNTVKVQAGTTTSIFNNTTNDIQSGGTSRIKTDGTGIGFFATAPVAKPTVTGAKGANAALGSLMTALSSLGLVTDSTT